MQDRDRPIAKATGVYKADINSLQCLDPTKKLSLLTSL